VTATTEPCDLHELTGCSICSGLDKKLAAEEQETFELNGPTAYALYSGKCPKHEGYFTAGTKIYRSEADWICCP
jgi:hypothetical protein